MQEEVLIIGVNSFLGIELLKQLSDKYIVTGVYNDNLDLVINYNLKLVHISKISELYDINYSKIFIVSAYIPKKYTDLNIDTKLFESNIMVPFRICENFSRSRIVYFSSVSVFEGRDNGTIINIDDAPSPLSKYSLSKLWSEKIVRNHPNSIILRISSMYGPCMNKSTFLPRIITDALLSHEITLLGDGSRMQNYIHVKDVAEFGVLASGEITEKIIFATGPKSYSNLEIAEMVQKELSCAIRFKDDDFSKSFHYNGLKSSSDIRKTEFINIHAGIKQLILWLRKEF